MDVTALDLAERFVGTKEVPGAEDNPDIRAFLYHAGLGRKAHDEVPWCASFVSFVAFLLALPRPVLPARARSWLTVGLPVPIEAARPGFDIVVLSRGLTPQPGADVIAAPGHVGFFYAARPGFVALLGGNQKDAVSVTWFESKRVLGVRRLHYEEEEET